MSGPRLATRARTKEPSEKAIHEAVIAHWKACGLPGTLVATIPNMGAFGQCGLTKGLPDLMVMAPHFGVRFIELKAAKGKTSPEQDSFATLCCGCGVGFAVTHGRDAPVELLEAWHVVKPRVQIGATP